MLLLIDTSLDDLGVECVGDERDDQVVLCDLGLKRSSVIDIERNSAGML